MVLARPLNNNYARGTEVRRQVPPAPRTDRPAAAVALEAAAGQAFVAVTDGSAVAAHYLANEFVRVTTLEGDVSYHLLQGNAVALDARPVTLAVPLLLPHRAGASVAERRQLLEVHALDPGAWGNRLRVSVEDESPGLVARTTLSQVGPGALIRLASATGVESGTVLELLAPGTEDAVGPPLKVLAVNRATGDITLAAALDATQQAAHAAAIGAGLRLGARSREFSLTVRLLRQPDPAVANRAESVLDLERFRFLSMDPRHSRYVETVLGATWVLGASQDAAGRPLRLEDRRSEGESRYVRVFDFDRNVTGAGQPQATLQSIRLGPEPLLDLLPDGRERPARHALADGDDSLTTLDNHAYIGDDDPEPLLRTGMFALRNEEEISIVACPGQIHVEIQNALINHCEFMRYRFAVLDAQRPPHDSLNDVQNQRQQFDTKYAALYHPWPLIPDPFPTNLAEVADYPIPPSGHVVGLYARTDIERGVHKSPANEVLRGVIGLQRLLNKGEQDILNPYPVNINVIRDFRPNNRGIRVWGGRVITSDPDWKYVNVRRLLIFIEASIDRGLQWVVFEPNAEPLWARVHRTVSNFLTGVWRDGALEGTKPEEAYFVKVDRTTMTQTDIDNGKLIVVIGVAPVKPAEFVIIRIGLWTAHADS